MTIYAPIAATYGVRVDQLLETIDDFSRYHAKLNKKLQSLKHRCQVTTKDTKKYADKEKYSKFDSKEYDRKNKLYGVLVLLHAERNLALAERLKLRARQRGKFKSSEKKVLHTRLKRAVQITERLVKLTKNENQWVTRAQYLIYAKIAHAEYLSHGTFTKNKDSKMISRDLSLSFAGLSHLCQSNLLPETILEHIQASYEYTLKQYAGNLLSAVEMKNFIITQVVEAKENDDELANLLFENGYKEEARDVDMDRADSVKKVQWRSFTAKIHDSQVENYIHEAKNVAIKNIKHYDEKLLKWQQALEKQEARISNNDAQDMDDEDEDGIDSSENDQILVSFIKYNVLFTSILRDNYLFMQLWKQWKNLGTSMPSKIIKYKELERICNNLLKYLQDVMELPGVYSDDNLLAQLNLAKTFFKLTLSSGCLAAIYQSKGEYMKSLALHTYAHEQLASALEDVSDLTEVVIPNEVLSSKKVESLEIMIKTGWSSVLALAEYEKWLTENQPKIYDPSVIELLDSDSIRPELVTLKNLFPMRPKLRPVPSKPTLFDLAFNYIKFDTNERPQNNEMITESTQQQKLPQKEQNTQQHDSTKKRGFLGIFGR